MKIKKLDQGINDIYQAMISGEPKAEEIASKVHYSFALSAKNLYRYLLLRSFDLRRFHDSLSDLGISSLRSSEGYVFSNLHSVMKNLRLNQGLTLKDNYEIEVIGYKRSKKILQPRTKEITPNQVIPFDEDEFQDF